MRSFGNLTTAVKTAVIDLELSSILLEPENRDILKIEILDKYFPESKSNYESNGSDDLPTGLMLYDSSEEYKRKIIELKNSVDENAFQEEVFIRSGILKEKSLKFTITLVVYRE